MIEIKPTYLYSGPIYDNLVFCLKDNSKKVISLLIHPCEAFSILISLVFKENPVFEKLEKLGLKPEKVLIIEEKDLFSFKIISGSKNIRCKVSEAIALSLVQKIPVFLIEKPKKILRITEEAKLKEEMKKAIENEDYEKAADIRDILRKETKRKAFKV